MVVGPGVEVKAVEGDALRSDRDDSDVRTDFTVEPVLVHAEEVRRVAEADEAGEERSAAVARCASFVK